MTKDLTEGKPMKLILGFALPLLFGFLFQQFYNVVDTMIVGKFLGSDALAAVGSTGSVNFLVIGFCMGICNGFAIPVAQQFGARSFHNLRKYVANSAWLSIAFAIGMTILTVIFCRDILTLMRTPEDIIDNAYIYIVIIFAGIPTTFLYNMTSGIIRSMGDSRTPVIFLAVSSFINIGLDILFIYSFHMGVMGAALATVIAQGVSGIACLIFMLKKYPILKFEKDELRFDGHFAKNLCGMGVPMGLQYSITAIGSVILQTAVNSLGTTAVAAITAGSKVSMFLCCPFDAMGSTMATYGGQNVGAGKLNRLDSGIKSCILLGAVYAVIAISAILLLANPMAQLFVDASETEIISEVKTFLIINGSFYFPLALVNIVRFMIQGMGFSQFAVFAGVFELVGRAVVALALVPVFGYTAVCFASPAAWIIADAFLIPAYIHSRNKLKRTFISVIQ